MRVFVTSAHFHEPCPYRQAIALSLSTLNTCALWRFSPTPQNDSGDFVYPRCSRPRVLTLRAGRFDFLPHFRKYPPVGNSLPTSIIASLSLVNASQGRQYEVGCGSGTLLPHLPAQGVTGYFSPYHKFCQLPSVLRFLKHPQSYPEPRLSFLTQQASRS